MPHEKRQKPVPQIDFPRVRKRTSGIDPVLTGNLPESIDDFRPRSPSGALHNVETEARTLADLEAGSLGKSETSLGFAPREIQPIRPIDPNRAIEDRLRTDRANFAIRQRADARRRQRLGLPPRQLGELPSLRTFARIRDASQISDAQIPGGVPTLNAPVEQINPDNLRDNQVYRTADDRFVRFNAEDGSFTDMVFNPRGGPDQGGAFEIDPDVDDPAAADVDELINARLVGLTSQRALESLDPVLAKNIRQRGIAVQAILDSDLSPQQKLETVKPMLAAMEKLFPEESPEEAPLPIHEAKDKFMDIDDEGNVTILNPSTGALTYSAAKPGKDTVPLTTGSTVQNYITKPGNYDKYYKPFFETEVEQIEDELAGFIDGGLEAIKTAGDEGFFFLGAGRTEFREQQIAPALETYIADNLSSLDSILQPTARRLMEEMAVPGVIPTDKDEWLGNKIVQGERERISRKDFIFNQLTIVDLPPELTKLANDRALITAGDQFEQVIRPGLPPGVPEATEPADVTPPEPKKNIAETETVNPATLNNETVSGGFIYTGPVPATEADAKKPGNWKKVK